MKLTSKSTRTRNSCLCFASLHNFSQPLLSLLFGRYVVCMSYYPALKKAETFRLALVLLSILLPLIGAVLAISVFNDIWFITAGFVAGGICTYFCVKLINKKLTWTLAYNTS